MSDRTKPKPKITRPVGYQVEYSYAGFEYRLEKHASQWSATPLPGQHHAAGKERYRRAAVAEYLSEYGEA